MKIQLGVLVHNGVSLRIAFGLFASCDCGFDPVVECPGEQCVQVDAGPEIPDAHFIDAGVFVKDAGIFQDAGSFECPFQSHECQGQCVFNSDVNSCGTRCEPCPQPTFGTSTCSSETCGIMCNPTHFLCGSQCIQCVPPAHATVACIDSACSFTCNPGFIRDQYQCVVAPAQWREVPNSITWVEIHPKLLRCRSASSTHAL